MCKESDIDFLSDSKDATNECCLIPLRLSNASF
jgi:hypothetical protein